MRALLLLVAIAGTANAGPTFRVGSTTALTDTGAPIDTKTEWGPVLAAGYRLGPVAGEAEYGYLIYSDGVFDSGSHRVGGALRVQLLGLRDHDAVVRLSVDAGAALRHGHPMSVAQDGSEVYEGVALEFGGDRAAWMFEVRHVSGSWNLGATTACRACTVPASTADQAWMLEASLAFGG